MWVTSLEVMPITQARIRAAKEVEGRKRTDWRGMLGGKVTGLVILRYSTVLCRDAVPQC